MLRPIRNGIFFVFEEEVEKGVFIEKTSFNFILKNDPSTTVNRARWARVLAVGHEVDDEDIKVGAEILIEPLKWTDQHDFEGQKFWKTDRSCSRNSLQRRINNCKYILSLT